jgi:hypothetical protein
VAEAVADTRQPARCRVYNGVDGVDGFRDVDDQKRPETGCGNR